jgi:hypothetical protein
VTLTNYQRLCSLFYDYDKPEAQPPEVDFFAEKIIAAPGPALEAMCGSGRLLLPLLRRGIKVEGVDYSPFMLARIHSRCLSAGLIPPVTYQQSLAELALPKRYGIIFIVLGSVQLLPFEELPLVFNRLHAHLLEGGRLVIDTFVPWELIEMTGSSRRTKRKMELADEKIDLTSDIKIDRTRQSYRQKNLYELKRDGRTLETEEEALNVRWYFPEEFHSLLQAAGFTASHLATPVTSTPPRRFIYEADRI